MNTEPHGYRVLMKLLFGGEPPAWREQAACSDTDPTLFHTPSQTAAAKAVCASCPVLAECRENQLSWEANGPARYRDNAFGVVGGLSGAERRRIHYPPRNAKDVA